MEEINLNDEKMTKNQEPKNNKKIAALVLSIVGIVVVFAIIIGTFIKKQNTPILQITNTSLSVDYSELLGYSAKVKGTAKNISNKNLSSVFLKFTIYDSAGNNLGTAFTSISNLMNGDTWQFEASLLSFPKSRPASYKLADIVSY